MDVAWTSARQALRHGLDAVERAWNGQSSPRSRRLTYVVACVLLALTCAVHATTLGPVFPVDDAYISLHNAMAFVDGEKNYVGVSPFAGATSTVHLVLIAALLSVAKPPVALLTGTWIAIVLWVLGVIRLAFSRGASVLQAAALALVAVTAGNLVYQLLNGLETGLGMAFVVWSLALVDAQSSTARAVRGVLCGAMPFVRPELGALSLLLVMADFVPRGDEERTPRDRAVFLTGVLVGLLPWLFLTLKETGSPLPSTIGAKRAYFAESCRPALQKIRHVVERMMTFQRTVGAIGWAAVLLVGLRRGFIGLTFGAVMLGAYALQFPTALDHYFYRYMYILLPFALFACAASLRAESPRRRTAATAVLLIGLGDAFFGLDEHVDNYVRSRQFTVEGHAETAAWARANLPANARVLVHDAGYFAYATPFELVDVVGLKTPSCIREHTELTLASCGDRRNEAIHRIALRTKPDYLVALRNWPFRIPDALRERGWQLEEIHQSPTWGYDIFRLRPPER